LVDLKRKYTNEMEGGGVGGGGRITKGITKGGLQMKG